MDMTSSLADLLTKGWIGRRREARQLAQEQQQKQFDDARTFFKDWQNYLQQLPPNLTTQLRLDPMQRHVLYWAGQAKHADTKILCALTNEYPTLTVRVDVRPTAAPYCDPEGIVHISASERPIPSRWEFRWRGDTAYPLGMAMEAPRAPAHVPALEFLFSQEKISTQEQLNALTSPVTPHNSSAMLLAEDRFTIMIPLGIGSDLHKRFAYIGGFTGEETQRQYHVYGANGSSGEPRSKGAISPAFRHQFA